MPGRQTERALGVRGALVGALSPGASGASSEALGASSETWRVSSEVSGSVLDRLGGGV